MRSKRQKRVADQIREILSELLMHEVRDPRLGTVTVMDVDIERELMYADVWVSSFEGEEAREPVLTALHSAQGFLRRELGSRMRMQHTPELRFHWDESLEYGDRIENLLGSLDISPADTSDKGDDDAEK
jgi:ribosome-binding factor A